VNGYGLGIDLGTTISLASIVDQSGKPEVVVGQNGRHLVPSAIYFDDRIDIGDAAMEQGLRDPYGLAEAFKRDMGKPHFSREIRSTLVPPEVLTAFLLRHILDNVKRKMGKLVPAVITVPAYFDERKRTATQQAARLAGLPVLDIINEPTAAAIALGHSMMFENQPSNRPRRLLVYDLGGGTFDVTLLEFANRAFRAIGTDGDIYLGGRDFDERIINIVAQRFRDLHGLDPRQKLVEMQRLWKRSREIKHQLSESQSVQVSYEFEGKKLDFELTRSEFEDAIEGLIERSMSTTSDVVFQAGLTWNDIDDFLLVGGSSRIPLVARKAEEHFGRTPRMTENPDELIAHGAALYAAAKSDDVLDALSHFQVTNVNAHSLGVRGTDVATKQRINKILIPRNTPLPASKIYSFVTSRDGQKVAKVALLEGESENPDFCSVLGECLVRIESTVPRGSTVKVTCLYTENGTISVTAALPQTNSQAQVEIKREGNATLDSLEVWTARLTTGGETKSTAVLEHLNEKPSLQRLSDVSDKDKVISRLDELYRYVGLLSMSARPPVQAVASHQLATLLSRETATIKELIQSLELKHKQTNNFHLRLDLSGQLAQLKMAWEHSMHLLDHSLTVVGRECVAEGSVDQQASPFIDEARELLSHLEA
jgi:molecular chaperone DnaK